ncbi:MAG: ATP-binding protein [Gammaproteobacteria bacterium]
MFKRILKLAQNSTQSFFLFGPRGVGKTSWIKENYPDALYFDLLNDDIYREFLARPVRLSEKIPSDYKDWVIIDEVQKIPDLLNEVHRLIENRKLKFILTGSSARSLRRKGVNLLAGRALTYNMHPLTTLELKDQFEINKSLEFGHLPLAYTGKQPKKYLLSYIKTYLREEVLQESLTRNIPLFARFLEVASFNQGEILSYTEISREIGSNRQTVSNFFDILEDMLIAFRLPVFRKRASRDVISHPRFYYFDVGVYRTIRPHGLLDTAQEIDGPALETLFLQEAKAYNDYYDLEYEFYYWRTKKQEEVDFVLYGNKGFCAFEIKRKEKLYSSDFTNLKAFAKNYPEAKLYLLYGGNEDYLEGDIRVIPYQKALLQLKDILS